MMRHAMVTVVFEQCRGTNGVPSVSLPYHPAAMADHPDPVGLLLDAAVEAIRQGAKIHHPGLGDDLKAGDFILLDKAGRELTAVLSGQTVNLAVRERYDKQQFERGKGGTHD